MEIKITDIQVTPITPRNGLVAFASVTLNNSVYLGSIGVYTRLDGSGSYRITYPTKKVGKKDLNIHRPTNEEMSKMIEEAIILKTKELFQTS
jgi:stage V sporulation protein G